MPRAEAQKGKLLWLARFFATETDEEHPASMQDIIDYLTDHGIPCERKGIYRDMEILREFGQDILQEKRGQYYLASRTFDLPELRLLADAVQSSKFITEKKSFQLIGKLQTLASRSQAQIIGRYASVIHRAKASNEHIFYTVDCLHDAISEDRQVSFHYYDWNAKKQRVGRHGNALYTVSPWLLVWDDAFYYLVAFDAASGLMKHYRVDKMDDVRMRPARREGKAEAELLSPAEFSTGVFDMFGGKRLRVVLRCADSLAGVILDRFGQEVILVPAKRGFFTVSVEVEVSPRFFGWVFALQGQASILSPEDVRGEYEKMLADVLACQQKIKAEGNKNNG